MHRPVILSRIKSSITSEWSLTDIEVEKRRIQYGQNDLTEVRTNRWLELTISTIKDPMIWFLIITAALFAILKNYNEAIILFLAIIPLIGIDTFLHWRTQASTQHLKSRLARYAVVIRNGIETKVAAWEIVPGDLAVISTGMIIPADGIIIEGTNLQVDESALSGEAYPAEKQILYSLPETISDPAIEMNYWGFAGTRLLTGRALLRVVYTGKETLYGEIILSTLQTLRHRTPLQKAINKLVFLLIIIAVFFCIILAGARLYQGFGIIDAMLSAVILAVAALPDEFPVVFTIFLGVGVYRLAKKKALVRRAVSVENIGRITSICSDKTGTITEGEFKLVSWFPTENFSAVELLSIALLASRKESNDLLDLAIIAEATRQNLSIINPIITYPFTEDRKRETSLLKFNSSKLLAATKGAPETILSISNLTAEERTTYLRKITSLGSAGYKVLACAQCVVDDVSDFTEPKNNYEILGLLAFSDPPRPEVFKGIKQCRDSNIHVLMITGDHPETARSVAKTIGLGDPEPIVVLADTIKAYLQKNDGAYFQKIDVIARAMPSQKFDIVRALQNAGEIVAVTGDGVNDVPALKVADIGIAMGERGTESAREVADIVLLDDNFGSIVNAIAEGRQLFKNLNLSFKYLLMIHIPFVLSAAIIPLLGFPLLYYPIHIVLIEILIHSTAILVFQDSPEVEKLVPVQRKKKIKFFSLRDKIEIFTVGIISTLFIILSFIFVIGLTKNVDNARALTFGILAFTSLAITMGFSSLKVWSTRIIVGSVIIGLIVLTQFSSVAQVLYFAPLHLHDWLAILASGLVTLLLVNSFSKSIKLISDISHTKYRHWINDKENNCMAKNPKQVQFLAPR